ncbi:hypothetical protein L4C36_22210 [Photobacterium japonica]|uniref:hypothetical protein n=1 Tax=Photobacterium japonica TaxID=2910235 RepID=UPI003D0E5E2C
MNRLWLTPVKQLTFQLFFHYRHFFQLSYYPILAVCLGASLLNIVLMLPSSNMHSSPIALAVFLSASLYWVVIKHYYATILAWSDTRSKHHTVHVLRNKRVSE